MTPCFKFATSMIFAVFLCPLPFAESKSSKDPKFRNWGKSDLQVMLIADLKAGVLLNSKRNLSSMLEITKKFRRIWRHYTNSVISNSIWQLRKSRFNGAWSQRKTFLILVAKEWNRYITLLRILKEIRPEGGSNAKVV